MNYLVLLTQTGLKIVLQSHWNIQWFHVHECLNVDSNSGLRLGRQRPHLFWFEMYGFIATNTTGNLPKASYKIYSGFTLTNVQTQAQAVVSGLVALQPVLTLGTWFCCHKHAWKMSHSLIKNIQWFHAYKCLNANEQIFKIPAFNTGYCMAQNHCDRYLMQCFTFKQIRGSFDILLY